AFGADGKLYALDGKSGALVRFHEDTAEKVLDSIGRPGGGKNLSLAGFSWVDAGTLAVADTGDASIRLIDIQGNTETDFGEKGSKAGMLKKPQALAFSINRRLYIADSAADQVAVYNRNGIFLYSLGQAEVDAGQRLQKPEQVAVDGAERVYVLQPGSKAVLNIYDSSGGLLKRFTDVELKALLGGKLNITAMTADMSGRVYLANGGDGKITQLNWETPAVERTFGSKGEGPGQYQNAFALAVSNDDRLAVADSRNRKIDIYVLNNAAAGALERVWLPNIGEVRFAPVTCTAGYLLGDSNILCLNAKNDSVQILSADGGVVKKLSADFKSPMQAAFNDKNIAVLDKNKVFVFTSDGKLLTQFGSSGRDDGELGGAEDIFLRNNRIYVVESSNRRVQIFSIKGVYLDKFPRQTDKQASPFKNPSAIAVDGNGNVYVADNAGKSIFVYSGDLEFLYELSSPATAPGAFIEISDLAIDTDNNLYVLCRTGLKEQTVQVYSGPAKVFEFGAYSKKTPTGIGKGVSLSVSPTHKTQVGVFDVVDSKNTGLLIFDYSQVPSPVGELKVAGGVKSTRLTWRQPPGAYISRFNVYTSDSENGDYRLISSPENPEVAVPHEAGLGYRYYRVAAVNGFGLEGPRSTPRENRFQAAYQAYQAARYEEAVSILNDALQTDPGQAEALKLLGMSLVQQKHYNQAAESFRQLGEYEGYKTEALNLQIEALYFNKDYAEAAALIAAAVEASDGNVDSYINCGRLNLKIGDPVGAVECLETGLRHEPDNTDLIVLLANAYIDIGATDRGLQQLDKAVGLEPQNIQLLISAGDLYRRLGKHAEAAKKYQQAMTLDETNPAAQLGLAETYMKLKDVSKAKNIAVKLAGNPESAATGNYVLGMIALQGKNYGEAVLALSKATRADAGNVDAWLALADAHQGLDKREQVKSALQGAVEADPASFVAQRRLGQVLRDEQAFPEAAEAFAQAAKVNPEDYEVLVDAADALFRDGQYNRAADYSRSAVKLKKDDIRGLHLAADIARRQGKTGEAIEYLKSAIALKKDDYDLQVELGGLYLENNLYDHAKAHLEQASIIDKTQSRAFVLLGDMYFKRRLFDQAIAEYEKAVKLDGGTENRLLLDTAYAAKKKSLEFSSNAPQLVLEDLRLSPVFSASYKQYAEKPVGRVKVRNPSGIDYGGLQVSFEVKGYMDFPTRQAIDKLAANGEVEIPLTAVFNNKILEIDEDTGVQVEVKLEYVREGQNDSTSITQRMTLYGKNAIVWAEPNRIGSFVTPKDDTLRDFIRQVTTEFKPESGPLNEKLVTAMTVFNALSAAGLRYEVDPSNPFMEIKDDQVDYVQFGRETLKLKSGDCDDLSVLFSAALENLGIETAILDVPGHLLMMFNTGLPQENRDLISAQDDLLVIYNNQVWIPLEVTMITSSFSEAWGEGARKYHDNDAKKALTVIPLRDAWQEYQPVTLKPGSYDLKLPAAEKAVARIQREQMILLEKGLDRLVEPFRAIAAYDPDNELALMQVAIIYAKYGLYDKAFEEFESLLERNASNSAVFNNRGNIYYVKGDFDRANEAYIQAERLDPSDAG
ncbi:MAG TPA: tetratricopeptide repeat protein, partial [Gammaproteobacteria bacterium]